MSAASKPRWQELYQQVVDKGNRVVQVATVSEDGKPACRTMGFGSFLENTQTLILNTHAKTFKAGHLAKHPFVEVCCWDEKTAQQFRLRGPVTVVDATYPDAALQAERQKLWDSLGKVPGTQYVKQWYLDPNRAPGRPFQERTPNTEHDVALVPSTQLLLKVEIAEVDYVNLSSDFRSIWTRREPNSNAWHEQLVNP